MPKASREVSIYDMAGVHSIWRTFLVAELKRSEDEQHPSVFVWDVFHRSQFLQFMHDTFQHGSPLYSLFSFRRCPDLGHNITAPPVI